MPAIAAGVHDVRADEARAAQNENALWFVRSERATAREYRERRGRRCSDRFTPIHALPPGGHSFRLYTSCFVADIAGAAPTHPWRGLQERARSRAARAARSDPAART